MSPNPYVIHVDRQNWNGQAADIRSRLMTWEWRWRQAEQAREVEIDFTDVEFMEPWALSMFACFGRSLGARGVSVRPALNPANPSNQYFRSMGLEQVFRASPDAIATNLSDNDTGLCVLESIRAGEEFAARAASLIQHVDEDAALRIKYCVQELTRNALQHGGKGACTIAIAQRFPELGHVQVAVCDAGQGVRKSLEAYYPEIVTDLEALRLAVLPRTSGAAPPTTYGGSGDQNQGLGLFFSREIAWRAGGSLWLASGRAVLGVRASDENGPSRVYRTINPWDGTLAVIHLPERAASDFSEIITVCHQLVRDIERDATEAGLEFADESTEFPDDAVAIPIARVQDDLGAAEQVRDQQFLPAIRDGRQVVLDFTGVRFLSTSIAQSLLGQVFRTPGSLTKLAFRNCTRATQAAIRTSAALARAGYRMRPSH